MCAKLTWELALRYAPVGLPPGGPLRVRLTFKSWPIVGILHPTPMRHFPEGG